MKNLIETAKNTHVPGKYDLRESELDFLYDNYRYDLFGLISFVFKLGFARGQNQKGGSTMTKEDMIALGIPKEDEGFPNPVFCRCEESRPAAK